MTDRYAELREALVQIDALDPEGHTAGFSVDALRGLIERMGAIARAALKKAPAYAEAETDMPDYAELLEAEARYRRAEKIAALLRERDEMKAEIERLREQLRLSTVDQVNAEAEANDAHAENKRLREALGRILENESSDWKAAEEFGGYVLDDELREEARAALGQEAGRG